MTPSAVHVSFWGIAQLDVVDVIRNQCRWSDAFVSPSINNWVTVFDADSATSSDLITPMMTIATAVCSQHQRPGIILAMTPSFVFCMPMSEYGTSDQCYLSHDVAALEIDKPSRELSELASSIASIIPERPITLQSHSDPTLIPIHIMTIICESLQIANWLQSYETLFRGLDFRNSIRVQGWEHFFHVGLPDPRGDR